MGIRADRAHSSERNLGIWRLVVGSERSLEALDLCGGGVNGLQDLKGNVDQNHRELSW